MEARPYGALLVAVEGGVATLTLNRPERRNAIGSQLVNELLWALEDAFNDPEVRSIVLAGAGKAFSAGGDFSQMTGGGAEDALPHKGDYKDLLLRVWRAEKPIIARVHGAALGGGCGLVAACTFAVASTAAELGTPEVNVGLFPFMIMAVLERQMGRRALVKMMLSGGKLSAAEAAAVGLVNDAVAPEMLDAQVKTYTDFIASKSPSTLRLGLRALADTEDLTLDAKLPLLSERLGECLSTDDAREGLTAFLQKRAPQWTGH